jgi:hypothetical protein
MTNNVVDRMRTRYLSELTEAEARAKAIRAKLQVLDEISAEEKQIGSIEPEKTTRRMSAEHLTPKMVTLPSSLTEACRVIVDRYGQERAITSKGIREHLLANGHVPRGKNFKSIIMVTLKRLSETNRILSEKREGHWVFRAKPDKSLL